MDKDVGIAAFDGKKYSNYSNIKETKRRRLLLARKNDEDRRNHGHLSFIPQVFAAYRCIALYLIAGICIRLSAL
jgi:hypothetical protein